MLKSTEQLQLFTLDDIEEIIRTGTSTRYESYIGSVEWQIKSARAKRAHPFCTLCRSRSRLETHHNTYVRLGHEHDDDLVILCATCHMACHGRRPGGRLAVA